MAEVSEREAGSPIVPTQSQLSDNRHEARPACFKSLWQEVLVVFTATMAVGISSIAAGINTVNSSFIARDLNMKTAEITWLSAASSLASGSFLLLFARIADLFGRRTLFIGSMLIFAVLSLGAGFAKGAVVLDTLNGLMGLMSAAAVPPAQGMLSVIYDVPSKRKNAAFACFSAGNPLGFVFGLISGGIISQIFNWRAGYWWMSIIIFIIAITAIFQLPEDNTEKMKLNRDTIKRFDVMGSLFAIAGTGLFSAALSMGSDAPQGWRTNYVIALLVIGVLFMVAFVFWELHAEFPIIPMSIFKNKELCLLLVINLLGFIGFPSSAFWISLYVQRVWQASALKTAVYLLPMAIGGILVNVVAAAILHRVSNKLLMFIGALGYTLAFLLYALNKTSYGYWPMIFPALCLAVVGADFEFNVVNMYVMGSLHKSQQSIASGLFQMLTRLSQAIGLAITTAIFDGVAKAPDTGYHAGDPIRPYSAVWWFATAAAGLSIFFVPFLKIQTQGNRKKDVDRLETAEKAEQPSFTGPGPMLGEDKGIK